jgi:hypothetical protein
MATIGGRDFFRFDSPEGPCFGSGPTGRGPSMSYCRAGHRDGFPSVQAPIIAAPAVAVDGAPGTALADAEIMTFNGFAADGVARIEYVRDGKVVAATAVEGNVYALNIAGQKLAGGLIIARDANGVSIYEHAY